MRLALSIGCLIAACSSPKPEPGTEPVMPAEAPPPSAARAPVIDASPLPAGVLAESRGKLGMIRVEDVDGMRRLVIDDVVQAAVPRTGATGPDPIVGVVKALRPDAETALVIGLGSGKTAADLTAAGMKVTAVELEPKVIEYAKQYFGYRGDAIASDGLSYLKEHDQRHDLVLMDAFCGMQAPYELVQHRALALMRSRTTPGGLTIVRGVGEPRDHLFDQIARSLRAPAAGSRISFVQMFGSGVGAEMQNLYLVASGTPFNLVDTGAPLWPVRTAGDGPLWAEPKPVGGDRSAGSRSVRLIGYVVRLSENGALALDLPHWEMGAARYLLTGKPAEALGKQLSATGFPTAGDIRSDGARTGTLHEVLGGGQVKRSDVRFSPLAAIVEGKATLISVVHPDAAAKVPESIRGKAKTDPRLPYGGALYRLEVDEVVWSLDYGTWRAARTRAAPARKKVTEHLASGELGLAVEQLRQYRDQLAAVLEGFMPPAAELGAAIELLDAEAIALPRKPTRFDLAAALDRSAHELAAKRPVSADAASLLTELRASAIALYEAVAKHPKQPGAVAAAKRLLALYDTAALEAPDGGRSFETKRDRLARKYRQPEPSETPPERNKNADDQPPE